MAQYRDKKLLASLRPKKRPHFYDVDTATCHEEGIPRIRKGCNVSVQEVLEFVLLDMYNPPSAAAAATATSTELAVQEISLTFAGRTDKGVHANGQVCLVHLPKPESDRNGAIDQGGNPTETGGDTDTAARTTSYYDYFCWKLRNDMNSRLPLDISVQHVTQLPEYATFDPRRDVTLKKYTYTVRYRRCSTNADTNSTKENSLTDETKLLQMIEQCGGPHSIRSATDPYCLWIVPWALCNDGTILPRLCQQFMGTQRNFYYLIHKADRDNPKKSPLHTIHEMSYEITNTSIEWITSHSSQQTMVSSEIVTGRFTFIAKSFRRTMIRNIVGYCIDACRQNIPTVPAIESLLSYDNNDRNRIDDRNPVIVNAAPASGLCLEAVTY
jgi:tRNA pseudouridine(38-40) synthase